MMDLFIKGKCKVVTFTLGWLCILLISSCGETKEAAHSHDHTGEGVHAHDAHGESIEAIVWTDELELFVEYTPLIKGQRTEFVTHLTRLQSYQAVKSGSVTVNLVKGQRGIRHTVDTIDQQGIFIPVLVPKEAGKHQLYFEVDIPGIQKRIDLGTVQVYASAEDLEEASLTKDREPGTIEFTKEQAWKIPFGVSKVGKDSIAEHISLVGKWMPAPGTQHMINAPASGNILYTVPNLLEGRNIRKGEHLMTLSGKEMNLENIQSEIKRTEAEFDLASSAYERKKELYELEVISDSEWQEVKKDFEVAKASYEQLIQNYADDGIRLKSPISGYVKKVFVDNGNFVEAGSPVLKIGSTGSSLIQVHINPADRQKISFTSAVQVVLQRNTDETPKTYEGKILSIGQSVNSDQPLLPMVIEVKNSEAEIEGSMVKVEISVGKSRQVISVPATSLLENFGRYSVVVQKGGESFEIRPVTIGLRTSEQVEITSGLNVGEFVVSKGTYQVKMASMSSSVPAHGHTH